MAGRRRLRATLVAVALLPATLAGCGGSDDDGDDSEQTAKPVAGTFVGKVQKGDALVSVVAAPPAAGQQKRAVSVYVCDARRVCESLSGTATGNDFTAAATGAQGEARGKLTRKAATGSAELGGETMRYSAGRATAAAGVYELTVTAQGRIRGASAAGVALTGRSTLPEAGSGSLKLADGTRLEFTTSRAPAGAAALEPGEIRLIVLPDGEVRGVGRNRRQESLFFVRSTPR